MLCREDEWGSESEGDWWELPSMNRHCGADAQPMLRLIVILITTTYS